MMFEDGALMFPAAIQSCHLLLSSYATAIATVLARTFACACNNAHVQACGDLKAKAQGDNSSAEQEQLSSCYAALNCGLKKLCTLKIIEASADLWEL